jgi:ribonuclease HI
MKYYAIRYKEGSTLLVHREWAYVVPLVNKKPGVTFKGFDTKTEAKEWLAQDPVLFRDAETLHKKDVVYAYVDGSYTSKAMIDGFFVSGWGFVIVRNDEILHEEYGAVADRYASRNITGELRAAMCAIIWARHNHTPVIVVHDYAGIANWALGYWKPKSRVAMEYYDTIKIYLKNISFEKVRGHQGVKWNEYADKLAKKAIEKLKHGSIK